MVMIKTTMAAFLVVLASVVYVEAGMVMKSGGEKGKGGELMVVGKKCMPMILKSSGKKGKGGELIMIDDPHCKKEEYKKEYKYVPVPVMIAKEEHYMHEPMYEHKGYDHASYDQASYGSHDDYYNGEEDKLEYQSQQQPQQHEQQRRRRRWAFLN